MFKYRLWLGINSRYIPLLFICAACAPLQNTQSQSVQSSSIDEADSMHFDPSNEEEVLPNIELSPSLFYQISAAEIAVQRGELGVAFSTYLQLARTTNDPRMARRALEIALYGGNLPSALEASKLWLQLAPKSARAQQSVLGLLISTGHLKEAAPILEARFKQATTSTQRQLFVQQLARLLSAAPNKAEALELAQQILKPHADDTNVQIMWTQLALLAGQTENALQMINAVLAIHPTLESAALLKAQILIKQESAENTNTIKFLEEFLQANPKAIEIRNLYARTLLTEKKLGPAAEQYEQILKQVPDHPQSLFALGALAAEAKNLSRAEYYFQRYLEAAKTAKDGRDTAQATIYLAEIMRRQNQSNTALQLLETISNGPFFANAVIRRAEILAKTQHLDQARILLQQNAQRNSRDRNTLILAEVSLLREVSQYKNAFDVLEQALKSYPDEPDLLYEYGIAAEKLGHLILMEKTLRKVIKLRPEDAQAYNALGYSWADHNIHLKEAVVLIEKALALAPDNAYILDSMGWVQYRLGVLDKAQNYLERARQIRADPEVLVHLGEVLWVQGDHETARLIWREAKDKDPNNELLDETLTRLKEKL